MKCTIVPFSAVATSNRLDAPYHILKEEHRILADELMNKFAVEELVCLAESLPYDEEAANAVFPRTDRINRSRFLEIIGKPTDAMRIRQKIWWRQYIAVYCAAAAQSAKSRVLEEVLELSRRKIEKLKQLKTVQDLAKARSASVLRAALVGQSPPAGKPRRVRRKGR